MKKPDPLENFWFKRAEAIGQPILGKLLGHVIRQDKSIPLWGLFYTTRDTLYFQTFKSTNWFSNLMGGDRNSNEDNKIIEIKASSIKTFQVRTRRKSLLPFLFRPEIIDLSWHSESNEKKNMIIETDTGARDFVATLPSVEQLPEENKLT